MRKGPRMVTTNYYVVYPRRSKSTCFSGWIVLRPLHAKRNWKRIHNSKPFTKERERWKYQQKHLCKTGGVFSNKIVYLEFWAVARFAHPFRWPVNVWTVLLVSRSIHMHPHSTHELRHREMRRGREEQRKIPYRLTWNSAWYRND